ncbi:hypothetical protein EB796_005647 [Bugula neritina]|uniref:Sulfhydryl oxidase n=1 Tax=Bugula neritina TaxID=10212 RepID=A0A7J7KBM2_BUGNE|nr:hypothetical protein EB796_005647 [Bugula neritina]
MMFCIQWLCKPEAVYKLLSEMVDTTSDTTILSCRLHNSNLTLLLFLLCLFISGLAAAPGAKNTNNLYPDGSPVVNLEVDSFYRNVQNSERCWLVLFYLSWCGHCIDYVPLYTSTATNLKGLSKYVQVSAINCAKESNAAICRDHGIVGYPTLTFIPSHTADSTPKKHAIPYNTTQSYDTLHQFVVGKLKSIYPQSIASIDKLLEVSVLTNLHKRRTLSALIRFQHNLPAQLLFNSIFLLQQYFPVNNVQVSESLSLLYSKVSAGVGTDGSARRISNSKWSHLLKETGILDVTQNMQLVGCRGSEARYRGYPCTLWTLFHTLSIAASEDNSKNLNSVLLKPDIPPSCSVLAVMRSYVAHFFTCLDCRTHFMEMSKELDESKFTTNRECVLWLWRSHNKVNKRLAGAAGEDPSHRKVQFPDQVSCHKCRTPKGMWNEDMVYHFLHSLYTEVKNKWPVSNSTRLSSLHNGWKGNAGLNIIDISLCYIIYIGSALVIALIFYCVVIRQRLYLRSRKSASLAATDKYSYKPIY